MSENITISKKLIIIITSSLIAIILGFIGLNALFNSEFYYNKTSKIATWFDRDDKRIVWLHSHYYPKESLLKVKLDITGLDKRLLDYVKNFKDDAGVITVIFVDKHGYKVESHQITIKDLIPINNTSDSQHETEFSVKINNAEMKRIKNIEYNHTHLFDWSYEDMQKDYKKYFNL